jgi:hypothetical protein
MDEQGQRQERRERAREADRTFREVLRDRMASSRFVLMDDGRIQRVVEGQPRSNETGEGEHES